MSPQAGKKYEYTRVVTKRDMADPGNADKFVADLNEAGLLGFVVIEIGTNDSSRWAYMIREVD